MRTGTSHRRPHEIVVLIAAAIAIVSASAVFATRSGPATTDANGLRIETPLHHGGLDTPHSHHRSIGTSPAMEADFIEHAGHAAGLRPPTGAPARHAADHVAPTDPQSAHHAAAGVDEPAPPGSRSPRGQPGLDRQVVSALSHEGRFTVDCAFSHALRDDPIVYPRQRGASHPHEFFGNASTDAYSTAKSLRAHAKTSCSREADGSAYWVPALYDDNRRVEPTLLSVYYFAGSKDNRTIEAFPQGLKMITRDARATWYCTGRGPTSAAVDGAPRCGAGQHLLLGLSFPDCWDGKYLQRADHVSHMAVPVDDACPSSHPVAVPRVDVLVHYPGSNGGNVKLAPLDDPSSPHADFINAWDQPTLEGLVRDCLNAGVECDRR